MPCRNAWGEQLPIHLVAQTGAARSFGARVVAGAGLESLARACAGAAQPFGRATLGIRSNGLNLRALATNSRDPTGLRRFALLEMAVTFTGTSLSRLVCQEPRLEGDSAWVWPGVARKGAVKQGTRARWYSRRARGGDLDSWSGSSTS